MIKKIVLAILLFSGIVYAQDAIVGEYTDSRAVINNEFRKIRDNVAAMHSIPSGLIAMWSGSIANIPDGWYLCDGTNGTPDLRDRFIVGARQDDSGTAKTNVTGSLTQSGNGSVIQHNHAAGSLAADSVAAHTHPYGDVYPSGGSPGLLGGEGGSANGDTSRTTSSGGAHSHTISGSTENYGTGTTNIAVYYALAFIMKS